MEKVNKKWKDFLIKEEEEKEYLEIADYCVGMSVNADLQWKKNSDVEFLKTKNVGIMKKLLSIIFLGLLLSGNVYAETIRLTCDGINTESLLINVKPETE